MPKKFPLYRSSTGLNVVSDPARIKYNPETGVVDLQACNNVELDRTGRISRRKGFVDILEGSMHSVFSMGTYAIAAWNYLTQHYLIWLDSEENSGLIVELSNYNDRLCYARIMDRVYYSNGSEKGYIEDKVNHTWEVGSYSLKDSTKTMSDPPAGHIMEITNGRMWIAVDNLLYFSEPFAYNWFDLTKCIIPHQGKLTLLKAVLGGIYTSDSRGIYYYSGTNPKEMSVLKVADYPAILGTTVQDLMPGLSFGIQDPLLYCCFATRKGICIGGPDGRFFNLTQDKIDYPEIITGSSVLKGNDNILFLFDS